MIKVAPSTERRSVINTLRGEFEAAIGGAFFRFDTRLSTIASIEEACGGRPIVEVLNGIIVGRRAKEQIPLIAAALAAADPRPDDPGALAATATVGEAEAFILALVFALGFTVAAPVRGAGEASREPGPLAGSPPGGGGGNSRSAA